jgi:hypothetical protein
MMMGSPLPDEIAPDSVLPCQFDDRLFGATRLQAEKRLQLAVLEDAVLTFHRCAGGATTRARNLLNEVRAWASSEDTSWPFAFQAICHSLNLDADYVRRGLLEWQHRRPAAVVGQPFFRRNVGGDRHQVQVYPALKRSA